MKLRYFRQLTLNNSLNHIHERALRLVHDNNNSFFFYILRISNEETIRQKKSLNIYQKKYINLLTGHLLQ